MKQGQKSAFKRLHLKRNQAGQAVVEYLLLGVIIVGLVIGVGKAFEGLNDGINRYIGDYVACLMEYGELPILGVADADVKKHTAGTGKKCDQDFAAFSFDEGRPSTGGSGSTNGSNSGNSSNQNSNGNNSGNRNGNGNNSGNQSQNGNDGDGDDNGGSGGLDGLRGNGRGRRGNTNASQFGGSNNSSYGTSDGGSDAAQKRRIVENSEEDEEAKRRAQRSPIRRFYSRTDVYDYRAVRGGLAQQLDKQNKQRTARRTPSSRLLSSTQQEELSLKSNRKQITLKPQSSTAVNTENEQGFTFGGILRWLMIAGMVIAIIIFFGGQVMNYSNSQD